MFLKNLYISVAMFSLTLLPSSPFAQDISQYPYEAVISCGMGNNDHINVLACFAKKNGVDTEMKLSNEGRSGLYKAYNFQESGGQELRDGYHILLSDPFSINIQNSHDLLILSLKIVDRKTNKIVFNDQASLFGVISFSSSRLGATTRNQSSSQTDTRSLKDDPSIQAAYKCIGTESGNIINGKYIVNRKKKIGKFKEFEVGNAKGKLLIKFKDQSPVNAELLNGNQEIVVRPGVFWQHKIDDKNSLWLEFQSDPDMPGIGAKDCRGNSKSFAAFEGNDKEKGGGTAIVGKCETIKNYLDLRCK